MRAVVSDTSPPRYLAEIHQLDLLPRLFETISIPSVVYEELQHPATPIQVRTLLEFPPVWLQVVRTKITADDPVLETLDKGERAALLLGLHLQADLILIDERKGVAAARQKGLESIGTLGILVLAARRDLVDLTDAFTRLRQTGFYCPEKVMAELIDREVTKGNL